MVGSQLDRLGIRHNCDKASVGRRKGYRLRRPNGHDYLRKYEHFFSCFREVRRVKLMELGIGPDWNMGASLKVWRDYFKADASFKMVDINENARKFSDSQVDIVIGDLGSSVFLEDLARDEFDIIIDDASHHWNHQILAFKKLFGSLRGGGIYVIEDIHTSFGENRFKYYEPEAQDTFQFFSAIAGLAAGGGSSNPVIDSVELDEISQELAGAIESVTFIRHACIICKNGYYL